MKKIFILSLIYSLAVTLILPPNFYAQTLPFMPEPGEMVAPSDAYHPVTLKGVKVFSDKPFQLNFIIDAGDSPERGQELEKTSATLIKYFLAALTVPSRAQWVNLSPVEADRIMGDQFEKTQLGRDLLAQDYLLKQLTSSLIYPEKNLGESFWEEIYEKVQAQLGTTADISFDMFTKVWIVPEKAVVYQNDNTAYVVDSHLKVMTEPDYLSRQAKKDELVSSPTRDPQEITNAAFKEIVIPDIEKEINEGKNFRSLRQMYHAVILATWYKRTFTQSLLAQKYADKNQSNGIALKDTSSKEKIYDQYVSAYKKGAYNFVKEDYDPVKHMVVPRHYFSGGSRIMEDTEKILEIQQVSKQDLFAPLTESRVRPLFEAVVNLNTQRPATISGKNFKKNPYGAEDNALVTNAQIPQEFKYQTIRSGDEAIFRIVIKPEDKASVDIDSLKLVTNMGGTWQIYQGVMELVSTAEDGTQTFEARSKIKSSRNVAVLYTFFIEDKETGQRDWINLPGNDGEINVVAPFSGRVATISMEFGGPLAQKAGGQGDVMYGKSTQIASLSGPKNAPIAIIPYFKRNIKDSIVEKYNQFEWEKVANFEYVFHFERKGTIKLTAEKAMVEGVEIYRLVIDNDEFFQKLYANPETEFYESIMLSRGGIFLLKHLKEQLGVQIDIVESNDHHTGLVLPYMRGEYKDTFKDVGHSMLLHNIGYQGQYPYLDRFNELGLPEEYKDVLVRWNEINMLAISASMLGPNNRVVTVSPRYVLETLRAFSTLGFLVDKLLAKNPEFFIGLLNGLSGTWNPETDKVLDKYASRGFTKYNYQTIYHKKTNKRAFQKLFAKGEENEFSAYSYGNLIEGSDNMLMVSTNRLESQKQLDLVKYQVKRAQYEKRKIDFVVIGDGAYEEEMIALAKEIASDPNSTVNFVYRHFNGDLEHLALASADSCLAPSDFEPGGLAHLKGMLFGAVPFVRWTGGLADTVDETGPEPSGFGFSGVSRTFSNKFEDDQVRGILSYVNWDTFINAVDQELIKIEPRLGKFEASNLDLFEAIGRAFQRDGVLNIVNKADKDKLFWEQSNGITNGWAIANADSVKKAVNERQFYRAIMRGLDVYENHNNEFYNVLAVNSMKIKDYWREKMQAYFKNIVAVNAMKVKAYWSDKIDAYYDLYQELKESVRPEDKAIVEAEFETGNFKNVALSNEKGFMSVVTGVQAPAQPSIAPLNKSEDSAMTVDNNVGGVDFNTDGLDIQTSGDLIEFSYRYPTQGLTGITINWLSPQIIDFQPIFNLQ